MKNIKIKESIFAALILSVMAVIGMNVYKTLTMTEQERFIQANIEALTDDSEVDGNRITCSNTIENEGKGVITRTKCSTCLDVACTDYSDSGKCKK